MIDLNEKPEHSAMKKALLVVLIVGIAAFLAYQQFTLLRLSRDIDDLRSDTASTTAKIAQNMTVLSDSLTTRQQEAISELSNALNEKQQQIESKVGGVEQSVGKISGTVSTLEKLSKTDPELLQKYSKIFFLNEHYSPPRLVEISKGYLYSEDSPESIHAEVWPYLEDMLRAAKRDDVELFVKSAFRSFDEQRNIKSSYSVTYGAGTANTFSADQGYSEHQLGTTVDFITTGLGGRLEGFDATAAYAWLEKNAYRYGFVLSYPKNNSYYVYEPWHWRYVGVKLARYLDRQDKYFYDLEQRQIDSYLADMFD
ncbi:MAG: hypothetical protein A3G52_02935 [Candidatus Taylorbacteria bacterium RIFCSPLOWO2_12_FULL_43_20]|uniref:D-alanyl-D-alanine carboxypeptidase-like core domain-containing protein n=1 Tax=Candidatus Taylorbacteria bacterium RIFCSPLOWO2_12_FULL_43_20 TaxID=1802332 RepID=A0A1G2P321_9BACT|nr:MAG: hypothetical protein A2825_03980 [Candidatus Taylorbacteria bacterium RIFCSPHIGHO2_01_FULL_43_120]OHA24189.1 MAG: hypothetical protein A3B98_00005 [Candidatus Taylorbacteria bacterium RIFCSPHIGHO2_02_FULL_43_55]OHA28164.1 MAG: hypothetical protein A3E92_02075 [Candidatus Taylorbacteria bacterium RIFCSPHIGHO2_12_FULL_42_34]OHA32190.1 MAG: hypothetical protein A3B09_00910 [Candidatus Taylorbacteria bacterium RIFCSPLOWO2_01_FULL_43_83]OHA39700.1 MAG: hypothetical protein A3H58_04560 [Candi